MQPRDELVTLVAIENRESDAEALAQPITPADAHFARSHFAPPPATPDAIVVAGAVAEPARFDLATLRSLAQRTRPVTLECAGNGRAGMTPLPPGQPWRRGAVSTAVWTGVPLSALLARVHPRDDAVEVLFRGADRGTPAGAAAAMAYERALPIGTEALIAIEMNGAPIPSARGGPIRLVVPGWYGMASVKWLSTVELITRPFDGWFQTRSYVYDDGPVTTLRVSSRIVAPGEGSLHAAGVVRAWGWAWSSAPIAAVDVSLDAGPWRPAAVAAGSHAGAWVRWDATLPVARPGSHSLRARARDAGGATQPEAPIWNRLGYGNNAVEAVIFTVR